MADKRIIIQANYQQTQRKEKYSWCILHKEFHPELIGITTGGLRLISGALLDGKVDSKSLDFHKEI
jgi:hypothetical protein